MDLFTRTILFIILIATIASPKLQALTVDEDKENVVASRLEGTWKALDKLTQQLTGSVNEFDVTFSVDHSVTQDIPKKFMSFFSNKKIYLAGHMKLKGENCPFLLTTNSGNPHLVYFKARGNDLMANIESFNLFIARAEQSERDILFIGGDFNNCAFMALERVPEKAITTVTLRGYLPSFEMQHPIIYDNQLYFDEYNEKGNMVSQNIVVYDDGLTPPSDRGRPIELKGTPEKVSLGGKPGTKGSYSNTILKVRSWKYLKKDELPKKN